MYRIHVLDNMAMYEKKAWGRVCFAHFLEVITPCLKMHGLHKLPGPPVNCVIAQWLWLLMAAREGRIPLGNREVVVEEEEDEEEEKRGSGKRNEGEKRQASHLSYSHGSGIWWLDDCAQERIEVQLQNAGFHRSKCACGFVGVGGAPVCDPVRYRIIDSSVLGRFSVLRCSPDEYWPVKWLIGTRLTGCHQHHSSHGASCIHTHFHHLLLLSQ